MIIKNNGRVGIGTNTPTETLDVNGTIKKLVVDYKLVVEEHLEALDCLLFL